MLVLLLLAVIRLLFTCLTTFLCTTSQPPRWCAAWAPAATCTITHIMHCSRRFPAATKLVCSLGPSSHSVAVLEDMLRAGMVAARIDLTWGGLDFHRATLAALNVSSSWTCCTTCIGMRF
jgi:hypothetical protein